MITRMKHYPRYGIGIALLVLSFCAGGANKSFTGPGSFSDNTKWTGATLPVAGDNLTITGQCTFDALANNLAYGTLAVGTSGGAGTTGSVVWPVGGTNTLNVTTVSSGRAGSGVDM